MAPTKTSTASVTARHGTVAEMAPEIPNVDRNDTTTHAYVLRRGQILMRESRVGARGACSECWRCPKPKSRGVHFWRVVLEQNQPDGRPGSVAGVTLETQKCKSRTPRAEPQPTELTNLYILGPPTTHRPSSWSSGVVLREIAPKPVQESRRVNQKCSGGGS